MTTAIICIFIVGYIMIAMENVTKVNKAAVALLMAVLCRNPRVRDPDHYIRTPPHF